VHHKATLFEPVLNKGLPFTTCLDLHNKPSIIVFFLFQYGSPNNVA
jgi:hypothetical protein